MKYTKNNAVTVSPDSTKYFYVYEIDCDGMIIPFNPKYLIPYLMNDQLSITSYSGDVYKSVRGTYGVLGGNSNSGVDSAKLEFKLTLKVETIRITIKELVDIIYSNYSFDTLEEIKKLVLAASCSKAMMISLLYLIFYNLIDTENDLEQLSKLEYDDLYNYVLNKLKMNCLTENPLKTNFGSYVDSIVGATAELSDSSDFCPVYDQEIAAVVNKDVYENIYKFSGTSLQYDKSDINATNKLTNDTTTWASELTYLIDNGYITTSTNSSGYKKYKLSKPIGMDIGNTVVTIIGRTIYNTSKHLVIKIAKNTILNCSSLLFSGLESATITEDVIINPGKSKDLTDYMKFTYNGYYSTIYFSSLYMSLFLAYFSMAEIASGEYLYVKEYKKNAWYSSLNRDLDYNLMTLKNDSIVEVLRESTIMDHDADVIVNTSNIDYYGLNSLYPTYDGQIYNKSDLFITIPAGIEVRIDWFHGFFFYSIIRELQQRTFVTAAMTIPPRTAMPISLVDTSGRSDTIDVNNYRSYMYNIRLCNTHGIELHISTSDHSDFYSNNAIVKPVDLLLFGNSAEDIDTDNKTVTVKGLAKANTDDFKRDFYWLNMTVAGITGSIYASQLRTETMSISNSVSYNDDLSASKGISNSITMKAQTANNKRIFPMNVNQKPSTTYFRNNGESLAYTNLLIENEESRLTVAPTGVLISADKSVGLTHRPRLNVKLDDKNLKKKENVEKLIAQLFVDNNSHRYSVTADQKDIVIQITKIKYKPKVKLDFYVNTSDINTVKKVFNDIQFLLNMSDITLVSNGISYATDSSSATITAVSLPTELGTGASSNLSLNQYKTFNTSKFYELANSNKSKLLLVQVELTAPDLLKTVDISKYNVYLYNGVLYRGSEMDMAG